MRRPSFDTRTAPLSAAVLLVGGAVLLYTVGALAEYAMTPLGRVPLLDARENLDLARAIAEGRLPREPFYRAPGFAALLALALEAGVPFAQLSEVARGLNALAHLASAALVGVIALRLWASRGAALLAAALYGLYPVAVYFAGDAQDTSLGIACFLAGTAAALRALRPGEPTPLRAAFAASLWFGVAAVVRPHYLTVVLAWCAVAGYLVASRTLRAPTGLAVLLGALLPLAVLGLVNLRVGGAFEVTPWQGAYNLWAGNGPGANGRYLAQTVRVGEGEHYENPARRESEHLYAQETGQRPPLSREAMVRHWRGRTVAHVFADPLSWLRLMAAKAFYLANDFEQYNNKTYALHRARQDWLRLNPLSWGWLLVGAAAAVSLVPRRNARALAALGWIAAAYAAGTLLFFASDRFRIPLAPLCAALAGGLVLLSEAHARRIALRGAVIVALAALLAFWPLPRALREQTFKADWLLLAEASNETGDYAGAVAFARAAGRADPGDPAAHEAACLAGFNGVFARAADAPPGAREMAAVREWCAAPGVSQRARHAGAVLAWAGGERELARSIWQEQAARDGPERELARESLAFSGQIDPDSSGASEESRAVARALQGSPEACQALAARGGPAAMRRLVALAAIYGRGPVCGAASVPGAHRSAPEQPMPTTGQSS